MSQTMTFDEILAEMERHMTGKTLSERLDACREIGMKIGGAPKLTAASLSSPNTLSVPGTGPSTARSVVGCSGRSNVSIGHICRSCGIRNDDAEANQSDGTYICYECRR